MDVVRMESGVAQPRREIVTAAAIIDAALARSADVLTANSLAVDVPPRTSKSRSTRAR